MTTKRAPSTPTKRTEKPGELPTASTTDQCQCETCRAANELPFLKAALLFSLIMASLFVSSWVLWSWVQG